MYNKLLQSITEQLFIISKRYLNINYQSKSVKAALMILLYNGYNSIVVSIFYCHCYATIVIVYIMHFFQYKELMQIKEKVWITSYLSGRSSPPSLPFAEVGIFFSGGSSWIFPYLLLILRQFITKPIYYEIYFIEILLFLYYYEFILNASTS